MFLSSSRVVAKLSGRCLPCWCPSGWAPTWRLHTNLYKFREKASPHILNKQNCCGLNLGENLCMVTFFLFSDSGLNLLITINLSRVKFNFLWFFLSINFPWLEIKFPDFSPWRKFFPWPFSALWQPRFRPLLVILPLSPRNRASITHSLKIWIVNPTLCPYFYRFFSLHIVLAQDEFYLHAFLAILTNKK